MNLYDDKGYLNWEEIYDKSCVHVLCTGGRGTGKTFGVLKLAIDRHLKFILLRRTQKQLHTIRKANLNPFRALENQLGDKYAIEIKNLGDDAAAVVDPNTGETLGLIMALTTISSLRGFDVSDTDLLIYDEFIPEPHERKIPFEGEALVQAIESIARNRELQGRPPMRVICLANSNLLANPLYIELGIVNKVYSMVKKGQEISNMKERELTIIHLKESPIAQQKRNTSLYKLVSNTNYAEMSIENTFREVDDEQVKPQNIKDYKPLVIVGELCIYKHKSKKQFYISDHKSGSPNVYGTSTTELKRFFRDYSFLRFAHLYRLIYFENYNLLTLFEAYIKI